MLAESPRFLFHWKGFPAYPIHHQLTHQRKPRQFQLSVKARVEGVRESPVQTLIHTHELSVETLDDVPFPPVCPLMYFVYIATSLAVAWALYVFPFPSVLTP